jgi:hypothetical protein
MDHRPARAGTARNLFCKAAREKILRRYAMTALNMASHIRHLYTQGLRDYEICGRIKTSPIFTRHTITRLCQSPAVESRHYINRKRGVHKITIVNDDPHWEKVDRFEEVIGGII